MPFFLFGAARSGTNAITWALEKSPDIAVKNEDNTEYFDHFLLKSNPHIESALTSSAPKPVLFKCFHDTPRARYLFENFPDSRAIYAIRQPSDCIGSFVNEFGQAGADLWMERFVSAAKGRSGMLLHICRDDPAAAEIAIDRAAFLLDELVKFGPSSENIAACYYILAHSFVDHIQLFEDRRFFILNYDVLTSDPQNTLRDICKHLSIADINIDREYWFNGRQFGKNIKVAPQLLALCETIYKRIVSGI